MSRRILRFASLAVLVFASVAYADEPLGAIFNRMKSDFANGDYKQSLADVEALDAASQKPGLEADRAKLVAPISFYRAASLAALGRADEARDEFVTFLLYQPNASITSPPFPRPVVDAFTKAQKGAAGRSAGLAAAYASFTAPPGWTIPADAQWTASPVRYLLTADQKKQYAALTTADARTAFVETFWKQFDPTPATDVNELRREFERRVAFADSNFGTDKVSGRETDRALVFAFLGPPTYASRSNVKGQSDAIAMLRSGDARSTNFNAAGAAANSDNLEAEDQRGVRETWVYRRGRVPSGVPFPELQFEFISKEGYGSGVLQKGSDVLQALGAASENARRDKKLN